MGRFRFSQAQPTRVVLVVGLVLDEGNDHAVKVEEEHDEMKSQLCKRFLPLVLAPLTDFRMPPGVCLPSCGRLAS